MRLSKTSKNTQRKLLDKRVNTWASIKQDLPPPMGWLKAIRESLGLSTSQLARRVGVAPSAIAGYEKSEAQKKITLESLQKAAHAMNCKLVYAIVPDDPYSNLEHILDAQSLLAARKIVAKTDQTMRLENQGLPMEQLDEQIKEVAEELKSKLDSHIWAVGADEVKKKKR